MNASHKRPIIGVTVDTADDRDAYDSPYSYAQAIEAAGGLPFLLPYKSDLSLIPAYVDAVDGILFTGGNDLDPAMWGEPRHPKAVAVDPARQQFELALLAEVEKRKMPALGVCLGSQLMNVYRGGSLHQFIPDLHLTPALEHRKVDGNILRHDAHLDLNSKIGRAIGKADISVNTYHKQAVHQLGRGLRVIATSPDGIIEGFEDDSLPLFVAVQWHPERLIAEPEHLAPFKLLVQSAEAQKQP